MEVNNFTTYPLDHSLVKTKIDEFINMCDPKVKKICKKIFKNTLHISFETFITKLNLCIADLLKSINLNRPIFIFIDHLYTDYKYKSNYWLYTYIINYIKSKTSINQIITVINNLENSDLQNNDSIIFIDDCLYTGTQMRQTIINLFNIRRLHFTFWLLAPYISLYAYENIIYNMSFYPNLYHFCKIKISKFVNFHNPITSILTTEQCQLMNDYYFGFINFNTSYLIYFDHKLADALSIINLFYFGIVPNQKNKTILFDIYQRCLKYNNTNNEYFHRIINKSNLDIVPIIKHCDTFTKQMNILSPKCPYPPYKQNFMKFIKDINKTKNNKIKSL